jgi:hypothetical protein
MAANISVLEGVMVVPQVSISFSTIYIAIGLLGSLASIWALAQARQRKKRSDRITKGTGYERGFTITFHRFEKHDK